MIDYLTMFWSKTYELFDSVNVPGFSVSIADITIGAFIAVASLGILKLIFGLGNSSLSAINRLGGNNKNIKIHHNRSNDEK